MLIAVRPEIEEHNWVPQVRKLKGTYQARSMARYHRSFKDKIKPVACLNLVAEALCMFGAVDQDLSLRPRHRAFPTLDLPPNFRIVQFV